MSEERGFILDKFIENNKRITELELLVRNQPTGIQLRERIEKLENQLNERAFVTKMIDSPEIRKEISELLKFKGDTTKLQLDFENKLSELKEEINHLKECNIADTKSIEELKSYFDALQNDQREIGMTQKGLDAIDRIIKESPQYYELIAKFLEDLNDIRDSQIKEYGSYDDEVDYKEEKWQKKL